MPTGIANHGARHLLLGCGWEHLELSCHQGVCERCPVWLGSFRKQEQLQMDKWYYYKEAVRQFINHTAERWMETQLKQKVWNNTFLQKLMICKKLLFVLFLTQGRHLQLPSHLHVWPYGINRPWLWVWWGRIHRTHENTWMASVLPSTATKKNLKSSGKSLFPTASIVSAKILWGWSNERTQSPTHAWVDGKRIEGQWPVFS